MTNLFTYGSLMCSDIMLKVAGCQADSGKAILNNYFRSKVRDQEYPGILPQQGATVSGILYFDLDFRAIHQLDIFEGELYQKEKVEVITENHGPTTAMTYMIKPRHRHILTGEEWSFNQFLVFGKKKFQETYLGFQEL